MNASVGNKATAQIREDSDTMIRMYVHCWATMSCQVRKYSTMKLADACGIGVACLRPSVTAMAVASIKWVAGALLPAAPWARRRLLEAPLDELSKSWLQQQMHMTSARELRPMWRAGDVPVRLRSSTNETSLVVWSSGLPASLSLYFEWFERLPSEFACDCVVDPVCCVFASYAFFLANKFSK